MVNQEGTSLMHVYVDLEGSGGFVLAKINGREFSCIKEIVQKGQMPRLESSNFRYTSF